MRIPHVHPVPYRARQPTASGCSGVTGRACMLVNAFESTLSCQGTASSAGCGQSLWAWGGAAHGGLYLRARSLRGGRREPRFRCEA